MSRLSAFDIIAVCNYVVFGSAAFTPEIIGALIEPFGAPHDLTLKVVRFLGAVVVIATLVSNRFRNPTPTNTVQVFDRTSGSTVEMKTVAAPAAPIATPKGPPPAAP